MSEETTEIQTQGQGAPTTDQSPVETASTEETVQTPEVAQTETQETQTTPVVEQAAQTETVDEATRQAELDAWKKKSEDFQKGMEKWKTIARDLKSQQSTPKPITEPTDDWGRIDQMLDQKLSRLMGVAETQERQSAIEEIAELPFTKELGPEIQAKLNEIAKDEGLKGLPFKRQLEIARSQAIADNAHLIAEISEGRGLSRAYGNQEIKGKAAGTPERSSAAVVQNAGSILDRVQSMTREEYIANIDEIERETRALLNIK